MKNFKDVSDAIDRERGLSDRIKELKKVNQQISKLTLAKEELTYSIISAMNHNHEGQKQYEYDIWKVEIKTPFIYSINKKLYESGNINLPENFNPIKKSISYSIDKKLCDKYMIEADKDIRDSLVELIVKKPGKPTVTIKDRQ